MGKIFPSLQFDHSLFFHARPMRKIAFSNFVLESRRKHFPSSSFSATNPLCPSRHCSPIQAQSGKNPRIFKSLSHPNLLQYFLPPVQQHRPLIRCWQLPDLFPNADSQATAMRVDDIFWVGLFDALGLEPIDHWVFEDGVWLSRQVTGWCAEDVYSVFSAEGRGLVLASGFQHSNNKNN